MSIFPTAIPQIEVLIHRVNGDIDVDQFYNDRDARVFCREEVKRESTKRVICDTIKFDECGYFTVI